MSGRIYRIGDLIKVDNLQGIVIDISLRTTKLRTYDQNTIIIPNSQLLKSNVINLTDGSSIFISSVTFYVDYIFNLDKVKNCIETVLKNHPKVIVKGKKEIRYNVRIKEWVLEIETLFWINDPENEEFIKSQISEQIKERFEEMNILPPLPGVIRKDYLENQK
jgi:small-conductance mechanosensitive channel